MRASAARTYAALHEADFRRSLLVRALLALRSLPFAFRRQTARPAALHFSKGIHSLQAAGFGLVAEEPEREIVLGIQGDFWKLCPDVRAVGAEEAADLQDAIPGTAVALWNFRVVPLDGTHSRLSTETRVVVPDAASRRRFRIYWAFVRPFSGLIRRSMLAAVRRHAERAVHPKQQRAL